MRNSPAAHSRAAVSRMTVHLYAICWNEMRMLEYFFRHYDQFVDRFVLFDDGSTDGTIEYARARPNVEVRPFPRSVADSFVLSQQALQNECWKESRGAADWVIVTAIDEHIHHPDLKRYLEECSHRGVTYIPALGFSMVSESFPGPHEHLARTRTIGAPDAMFSKLRIFDPDAIEEVHFAIGGHGASVTGRRVLPDRDELLLLHYKDLGVEYVRERHRALGERLLPVDIENKWGYQYFFTVERAAARVQKLGAKAIDVSSGDYCPWRDHQAPRWWRPLPPVRQAAPRSRMRRIFDALRGSFHG